MTVTVKLEYYGRYVEKTGKLSEELSVSTKLQEAYDFITKYITQKYEIMPPFILMFEKMHITGALKKQADTPIKDGDTFKLLPFISGG